MSQRERDREIGIVMGLMIAFALLGALIDWLMGRFY